VKQTNIIFRSYTQSLLVAVFILLPRHALISQELNKYTFIQENLNHLYFSKDSSAFLKFYEKLGKINSDEKNRITVVHMGGSHVQGGTWSNTFISNFQNEFKTEGGGYFAFPYKIAKTNGQSYVNSFSTGKWKKCRAVGKEFCLPLGMSAMSITTNDSVTNFGLALTKTAICSTFNQVKVYHNFNASFQFSCASMAIRKDSAALGYSTFQFTRPLDSIAFDLVRMDTLQKDFIIYGFSLENDLSSGFYLAGLGANGASSSSFLKCLNLVEQLQTLNADLMIISLGVNDTQSKGFEKEEYIEHYDSLITMAKKANPDVAIILTTTTDNYIKRRTSNKKTIVAHDAMFELMKKHHVAVWDLFSIMGGYKSMTKWYKAGLASKDKVHFSPKGYAMLGDLMFEALYKPYLNKKNKS
jgi:lysophospholipase L1-like esterase